MTAPRFTIRQLDAFVAAAELSNFSLAARRLHLTPSAVSNLISELEAVLGFAVFERTTRRIALTSDGRQFLPSAIGVQRQLTLAAMAAADMRARSAEVIRVAAPLSLAAIFLPGVVAAHTADNPRATVRILDTGVEWLADRITTGAADLAIGPDRLVSTEVRRQDLCETRWVAWCAPGHQFAERETLRWEDLSHTPLYAAGRDHEHSVVPRLLDHPGAARIQPTQVVENITTALGMAQAGLGVTCSPSYVRPLADLFGLRMCRLIEPEVVRHLCIYISAERPLSDAAGALRERIEDSLRTLSFS